MVHRQGCYFTFLKKSIAIKILREMFMFGMVWVKNYGGSKAFDLKKPQEGQKSYHMIITVPFYLTHSNSSFKLHGRVSTRRKNPF